MDYRNKPLMTGAALLLGAVAFASLAHGHGDVNPQPVETEGVPELDGPVNENPYRDLEGEAYEEVVRVGERGYRANCAACHGIGGVSGGVAPDLRLLEPGWDDEYYIDVARTGAQGMPAFEGVLDEEALWAIKTWLETMHEDAMEEYYGSH